MIIRKIFLQIIFLAGCAFIGLQACKHEIPEPVPPITPPDTIPTGGGGGGCDPDTVYFYNTILPLITSNCAMEDLGCHDAVTARHDVVLTSYSGIRKEVRAKDPDWGKLYYLIEEEDKADKWMPKGRSKLPKEDRDKIKKWIEQGALGNKCIDECDTTNVTYDAIVKNIFDNKCRGCHNADLARGSFRLDNYDEAYLTGATGKIMPAILHQNTEERNMPQGLPQLDSCKINAIRIWIETGMPE